MTRLSGNNDNRSVIIIGALIAAALIALALWAVNNKKNTEQPAADGQAVNFTYADMPYAGKAEAPVNVVVIEDFKCPACKQFEDTVHPELVSKYVDTGKIKLYSLVWPFISSEMVKVAEDDSLYAAQAAKCVFDQKGNDGFNAYKTILFRAQGDEREVWATKAYLKELAGSVEGLDQAKFDGCLDNNETLERVNADKEQAKAAGVTGTPTVFVNGEKVDLGSDPMAALSTAIDAAK